MKVWKDYVNEVIAEFKEAGKNASLTEVLPIAKKRRNDEEGHPHKGQASKTRKGRKDFVTHKGDKKFNRKGHRQSHAKGSKTKRAPYKGGSDVAEIEHMAGGRKRRASKKSKRRGSKKGGKKSKRRGSKKH